MRVGGIVLIVSGLLALILYAFGVFPSSATGMVLFLALAAPITGAVLIFVNRFMARPAGIDNDGVFFNSVQNKGIVGVVLGVFITGFYVNIYLGDDITLGETHAAIVINESGLMTEFKGELDEDLKSKCQDCAGDPAWWSNQPYDLLFPWQGTFHTNVNKVLSGEVEQAESYAGFYYKYRLRVVKSQAVPGAIVEITQIDTMHHLFTRHVYSILDPLSYGLGAIAAVFSGENKGGPANNWFFYGTMYTLMVVLFGVRMLMKYRHSRYHMIRTGSVMFFQLGFAYLLPTFLKLFKQPEFYFSYFWPLKPEYFYPATWMSYISQTPDAMADGAVKLGSLLGAFFAGEAHAGVYFVVIAALMTFVATPVLTYFYGKRWYCSWVCGCGGLAETMGDPFRQLSDKSLAAWQAERWIVHGVLVFITIVTLLLWSNSISGGQIFGSASGSLSKVYGLYIGAIFSGVVGVGFYPIMGSRVWCRFGCPMAAILGIIQKYFSRFRITTNGGQCISCGNCSTYCEMGIDVRWYAQRGQNIIRASCVGCGVCSAVCPRGVLNLENGSVDGRYNDPNATVLREPALS